MSKVVFIVGATKGIGLAAARQLHAAGYTVFGTGRRPEADTVAGVPMLPLDVTDEASVAACVEQVLQRAGRVDVLVNSAGYDLYGAAEETDMTALLAQIDTNFLGSVRVIRALLPHMRARGSGTIINVSSIGGLLALPYNGAYAASKYALEGYSEALRYELRRFGLYVSLVEPGGVSTDTLATSIQEVPGGHPVYAQRREAMTNHMRRLSANGLAVGIVARTIVRVVRAQRPRLRYPVGGQARFVPLLKALLPQAWFEQFVLRQFPV